ncbi:MAG: hypothetical protein DRP85_05750 [Candidatus Makaraimicrobium thalassicum]|nr:MAG: hypothetical protein DRP85_05750 [Candidatus Omnitrophota bacterium]
MREAKFAMAFHCCQPVFNFEREIERAYKKAYSPLLRLLGEFPGIKASFHYPGSMLEWFERRHPDHIERMKKLVRRDQIELMGGGCFDPVMPLIPERDRQEQLRMNEEIVTRIFGVRPRGAWIGERVWEPGLADTLAAAGVGYTIVDDHHMRRGGVKAERIFSPCLTRGKNSSIIVFPSLMKLRYSMPFRPPEATLDYIKGAADKRSGGIPCFFFADDGEKFGLWPHTHWLVYTRGWLRDFFLLLEENAAWLRTATYSEVMDTVPAEEVGEIPESSYAEMMEWSGGSFKNFLKKYPEAGRMHRRMISVSDMVGKLGPENGCAAAAGRIQAAKKELFMAQTGCAYWHGTFGGLYLPHLRSGVYTHLIKAQKLVETAQRSKDRRVRAVERELVSSGGGTDTYRETVIGNELVDVFVKSSAGGRVTELDYKPLNVNLGNTMSRVREDYHKKLGRDYSARVRQARTTIARGGFADIHDALGVGERGLRRILFYDDYQRDSFLTHVFRGREPWKDMRKCRASFDSFLKGEYASHTGTDGEFITHTLSRRDSVLSRGGGPFELEVIKKVTVGSSPAVGFSHRIVRHSGGPGPLRYAVEFNFLIWDRAVISRPRLARTDRFSLKDRYSGIGLDFFLNREFTVFMYPVYTVNETESGLKKTFQGVSALIGGDCGAGDGGGTEDMKITISIG